MSNPIINPLVAANTTETLQPKPLVYAPFDGPNLEGHAEPHKPIEFFQTDPSFTEPPEPILAPDLPPTSARQPDEPVVAKPEKVDVWVGRCHVVNPA